MELHTVVVTGWSIVRVALNDLHLGCDEMPQKSLNTECSDLFKISPYTLILPSEYLGMM